MTSELEQDLAGRVAGCGLRHRLNYFFAYAFLVVGVVASAWATVAVAAGTQNPSLNAVLAALPGVSVMVLSTFKFSDRADWWSKKGQRLDGLRRGLRDERRQVDEVSRELTAFLQEHSERWPSFGQAPGG
jgi:hypothetical protein